MRVITVFLLGAFAAIAAGQDASTAEKEASSAVVAKEDTVSSPLNKQKYLFGSFSTTTYTIVSAVTSTVFFSCLSGTDATVCAGRNARRFKRKAMPQDIDFDDKLAESQNIESSLETSKLSPDEPNLLKSQDKLAFTIWTTSRTTTSVTVFSTNTATTIRVSFYCQAGGIQLPTRNCVG